MSVFTSNIFETLIFTERTVKNIYRLDISEKVTLSEKLNSNIKVANVSEHINISDKARRSGGIRNLTINETLQITQAGHPKVKVYDVYEVLSLIEFVNMLVIADRLILVENLSYNKIKTIIDTLLIVETLTFKASRNLTINEALDLQEAATGYVI